MARKDNTDKIVIGLCTAVLMLAGYVMYFLAWLFFQLLCVLWSLIKWLAFALYCAICDAMEQHAIRKTQEAMDSIEQAKALYEAQERATQKTRHQALDIERIDALPGEEFELFLTTLFEHRGYTVTLTARTGDLGVDLVAESTDEKIAVQAKRWSNSVSRHAVSDVVAGATYYGCNKCMVVTNLYYTEGAKKLAQSTGCVLIDRDTLSDWINEMHCEQANRKAQ
jgi:restriction system protein